MAQDLAERSRIGLNSVLSTVREVQVDGNTLSTDGQGKIMYDGADGSHAEIFPDGSASYDPDDASTSLDYSWTAPSGIELLNSIFPLYEVSFLCNKDLIAG